MLRLHFTIILFEVIRSIVEIYFPTVGCFSGFSTVKLVMMDYMIKVPFARPDFLFSGFDTYDFKRKLIFLRSQIS